MEVLILIVLLLFLIVIGGALFAVFKRLPTSDSARPNDPTLMLMQEQLKELRQTLALSQGELSKQVQTHFGQSMGIIKDVTERLTKLDETNRQVVNFTDQLKDLQDILKNPKQRGILGEYYLETLLKNVLPPGSFEMQYKFADGEIVDAAVFVKDKVIPVDSKFSLENYNRVAEESNPAERDRLEKVFVNDLKMRIQETAKYIRPNEGTLDFAFMFIPHEAIYYDLIVNKIGVVTDDTENLIQRAASKYHVIIVSPTSFLAYLQTVLQGLRALQIEESAKEIRQRVEELGKHIGVYDTYMQKLGTTLGTTVNHYNSAYKEFKKIDKDVYRIAGESAGIEPLQIDRPVSSLDE